MLIGEALSTRLIVKLQRSRFQVAVEALKVSQGLALVKAIGDQRHRPAARLPYQLHDGAEFLQNLTQHIDAAHCFPTEQNDPSGIIDRGLMD